jgi:N-acetylglutamate synthase-like GNAT family acetyltransferase
VAGVRAASADDVPAVAALMEDFVARGELLARTTAELSRLLPQAFVAEAGGRVLGFAALEIYSPKLSEIQCLAFDDSGGSQALGQWLVERCVARARQQSVLEVMAVVPPAREEPLRACGFDFSLPNQRKALFIRTAEGEPIPDEPPPGPPLRGATAADVAAVAEFIAPFVARGELLPRTEAELEHLLQHAFLAEASRIVVGFAALEIYSPKLAEIQCLSVDEQHRGQGVGRQLVAHCVRRARRQGIAETMAISSRDGFLTACGFSDCLPGEKITLFLRTRDPGAAGAAS